MKIKLFLLLTTLAAGLAVPHRAAAQGTAFTYQSRLNDGGAPANGSYDLQFMLYDASAGGSQAGPALTNSATAVSNGLFTVTLDFGAGVFTGTNYWLDVSVRTNGASAFTELSPRQELTPVPYAIFANTSSNLSGTVSVAQLNGTLTNGQLAHSAVTVDAGPGLSGGGRVTLGNTITLTNTGVLSVTGNADITAMTVGGAVTLGSTATSADTANAIVSRDGSGNFSAATISLDGNLNLPATSATTGIIYSGGAPLIHAYGSQNFFAGPGAGNLTMSGHANTANGYVALIADTGGSDNTADGAFALFKNTAGSYNTANGAYALYSNTNGSYNAASGYQALFLNTGGSANTANGYAALDSNTTGNNNSANGAYALASNTNGSGNTANGYAALDSNTTGNNNSANGAYALASNTNGSGNTANGYHALYLNTSGSDNVANGRAALYNNTIGSFNTACGVQALNFNTNGIYNTADGYQALFSNTGGDALFELGSLNTAVGNQALFSNTMGQGNTAVGYQALFSNMGAYFLGYNNTAVGESALYNNTSGADNTALGAAAGANITGNFNIDISNVGTTNDNGVIRIGEQGTQTTAYIAGIWNVTLPGAEGTPVYIDGSGQLGTATSSKRFKEDIQTMAGVSEAIYGLRPVTFKYKAAIDPKGGPEFGLIAEEVAQVDPNLVVRDRQGEIYTVRYEAVNAMMLNEFLKEHRKVEEQSAEIQQLSQSVQELKAMVARLAQGQTK